MMMKPTEKSYLGEEERKKVKIRKKAEIKKQQESIVYMQKQKEIIREAEQISDDLQKLRELLEAHVIDDDVIEKVIEQTELNHEELEKIFEKIDAIEKIDGIDNYLSRDLRITKDEYAEATHNSMKREIVQQKIEVILGILAQNITPLSGGGVNIFSGFLTLLDKNLITIQEHHIDMKDNLKSGKPRTIWESIILSFKK